MAMEGMEGRAGFMRRPSPAAYHALCVARRHVYEQVAPARQRVDAGGHALRLQASTQAPTRVRQQTGCNHQETRCKQHGLLIWPSRTCVEEMNAHTPGGATLQRSCQ